MSVEIDPNAGPLTLHHDSSPRNLQTGPAQPQLWQDFRFKGFPDKSFHAPKIPKYKRMSLDLMNTERDDQYFGKTTRFDTVKRNNRGLSWRPNEYKPHNLLKHKSHKRDLVSVKAQIKRNASKLSKRSVSEQDLPSVASISPVRKHNKMKQRTNSEQNLNSRKEMMSPLSLSSKTSTVRNQDPAPVISQIPLDDKREPQYTVRDPLGNLTDRRYVVRDPYGDFTEEHKYKLQREMRDLEEDKKQRDIIEKIRTEERQEERKKDKEMLTNYYPWGKPGGGAPTDDTRKQKFLETDLSGSPTPSYRERMITRSLTAEELDFMARRQRQQEFLESWNWERDRQAVEERFRYNQDRAEQERYSQELMRQKNEHELRKQEDRLDNLQRELETLKTDNYGKPGGGAPNRTSSESFTERRQKKVKSQASSRGSSPRKATKRYSVAKTDSSISGPSDIISISDGTTLSTLSKDSWDPWGQGIGNPERKEDGSLKPRQHALEKQKIKSNFHGPFTHKSTKHNDPNNKKTTDNKALVTNINRDTRVPTGRYSPFGKGIGNPQRDRNGNVKGRKMTLDTGKPQDTVEAQQKTKKRIQQVETSRDKTASPVTNINRDTKINWSDNTDSPRWGQGIGNPQRNEDGMILPRPSLLERKHGGIPGREGSPETNINRNTRLPYRPGSPWGKGVGNPRSDDQGNFIAKKSMTLDKNKPTDNVGPSAEKKRPIYDPAVGLNNTQRRNQTPEIKLHAQNRPRPASDGNYDPWGQGYGAPQRDEMGYIPRKNETLNSKKPVDTLKGPKRTYEPSSMVYGSEADPNNGQGNSGNRPGSWIGKGAGNPQRDSYGNVHRSQTLDTNKPKDGPNTGKKKKTYDPTAGGIVNSPRRNQTPDIKPNLSRMLPSHEDDYDPWGKGAGNPDRNDEGYIQPRNQTLDAGRPVDNSEKIRKPIFDPSSGHQLSPRGNQTPDIKLHVSRPLPSNNGDYNPWGKGFGNPSFDESGKPVRKVSTLDTTRPPDGITVDSDEPLRRPKPMSDLSYMMNRNRTQNITPVQNGHSYSPEDGFQFGKGAGNPVYDDDGNVIRHSTTLTLETPREPMESMDSPRRAPPSNRYDSWNDVGRSLPYADRLARINREVLPLYHPFGRAGGGAPNKDQTGHVVTQIQGNLNMENYKFQNSTLDQKARDRARAKEYYDFLKGQEEEQRRNKQEIEYHMKAPIGELATIMGSKNVGKPVKDPYTGEIKNHHLGNSDVTLQKMNYQPKAISEKKKYHEDLSQLADERMRYRQLNRLKDNQEGMLHHHTMDAMWGRPGGGAPKGYNLRKFNLESTLHHPSKDQTTEEYIKKKDWSQVTPEGGPFGASNDSYSPRFQPNKYVRSTVTSNHANLYEYPEHHKDKHYALTEPYATF